MACCGSVQHAVIGRQAVKTGIAVFCSDNENMPQVCGSRSILNGTDCCWVRTWQFLDRRWFSFSIQHMFPVRVLELRSFVANVTVAMNLAPTPKTEESIDVYIPHLKFGEKRYFAPVLIDEEPHITATFKDWILTELEKYIPISFMTGFIDIPYPVTDIRHQDAVLYHVRDIVLNKKSPEKISDAIHKLLKGSQAHRTSKVHRDRHLDGLELKLTGNEILAGLERAEVLPIFHAFTGCDTVSCFNGRGKKCASDEWNAYPLATTGFKPLVDGNVDGTDSTLQKYSICTELTHKLTIAAGVGRIVPFEQPGAYPHGVGEMVVLISSKNLPASDDLPIVFVNVDVLSQAPIAELKSVGITDLYTRWKIGQEEHRSKFVDFTGKSGGLTKTEILKDRLYKIEMKFHDHYAIPLNHDTGSQILSSFIDDKFQVELRGIRPIDTSKVVSCFFGYSKDDKNYDQLLIDIPEKTTDVLLAVCPVDASKLAKGINSIVWGEYPLYPPQVTAVPCLHEPGCTNDINSIRSPIEPTLVVQPSVILEAQMNLEISVGFVGCKPPKMTQNFSRFYCLVNSIEVEKMTAILYEVMDINEHLLSQGRKEEMLTGFAVDAGNVAFIYIEGPRDGQILHIWEMTGDFYPAIKPFFSTASKYSSRIYPDLLTGSSPFNIYKMYAPLGAVLACPPVYVRPAVPLPARSALLKLGRIFGGKLNQPLGREDMPTVAELRSFRLEFVVAPKPNTMCALDKQGSTKFGSIECIP